VDDPAPAGPAWTGASICLGGAVEEACREVGAAEAQALHAVLAEAVMDADHPARDCRPDPRTYAVRFLHPAVRAATTVVPLGCGPVTIGTTQYRLDGRERVKQAYDRAVPVGTQAFLDRCAAEEGADLAPELLGLTEDELVGRLGEGSRGRVVGRDGTCLARPRDLDDDRVHVLVEAGRVVWAGRS
jgi:hypothetical protein